MNRSTGFCKGHYISTKVTETYARSPEVIEDHQRSSKNIRGHRRSPEVIECHPRSTKVTRGHQRSSEVIRGHRRSPEVIGCRQRSKVTRDHWRSPDVIEGHQRWAEVSKVHQWSSNVTRGHRKSPEVTEGPSAWVRRSVFLWASPENDTGCFQFQRRPLPPLSTTWLATRGRGRNATGFRSVSGRADSESWRQT